MRRRESSRPPGGRRRGGRSRSSPPSIPFIDLTLDDPQEQQEHRPPTSGDLTPTPRFFKVFFSDLHSQRLGVPPRFVKHLEEGTCSLEGPSGNGWVVELVRAEGGGGFFFGNGWEGFARDHCLETGEFLVFEYRGNSRFGVVVFDRSACEKESALAARPFREDVAKSRGRKRKGEREGGRAGAVLERGDGACNGGGRVGEEREEAKRRRTRLSSALDPAAVTSRVSQEWFSSKYVKISKEIKFSDDRTIPNTSENPFFSHSITEGDLARYKLYVPSFVAKAHLPRESRDIVLRMSDETEFVFRGICQRSGYCFSAGWNKFCCNNDLKAGDVCGFEMIKKYEFRVYIYRAAT